MDAIPTPKPRGCSTICLPIDKDRYSQLIDHPARLRPRLDRAFRDGPPASRPELPTHLVADEHHQPRDGVKNYVATTVAAGCRLGAALAESAGAADLEAAYGVFKQEAQNAQPGYAPATVNTDGWAA